MPFNKFIQTYNLKLESMKKSIFLITALAATLVACNEKKTEESRTSPDKKTYQVSETREVVKKNTILNEVPKDSIFTFDEYEYDFGTIKQGSVVKHSFSFTNTSDRVVTIINANASCGCTVPTYEKGKLLQTGDKGIIDVEFNSAGKSGKMLKSIRVYTDASKNPIKLKLIGIVEVEKK